MARRRRISGKALIKALTRFGFQVIRVWGSHHRVGHPDGRITTVPVHAGETIGPGLLAQILRDCDLTYEQIEQFL
jgi:predicted RNA binding protein YcfA (HicA-like mRNA interferase family)